MIWWGGVTFHWPIHGWSRFETAESWKSFLTPGTKSDTIHCVNLLCIVFTVHCHHCESWVLLSGGKCLSSMNVASVSESQRIQVQTAKLKTHCIAPQINLSYPLINIMFIIIIYMLFDVLPLKRMHRDLSSASFPTPMPALSLWPARSGNPRLLPWQQHS